MWKSRSLCGLVAVMAMATLSMGAIAQAAESSPSPQAYTAAFTTSTAKATPKSLQAVPAIARDVAATASLAGSTAAETFTVNAQPEVALVTAKAYATSLVSSVPERPRPVTENENTLMTSTSSTTGSAPRMQADPDPNPRSANFVDTVLSAAIGRYGAGLV